LAIALRRIKIRKLGSDCFPESFTSPGGLPTTFVQTLNLFPGDIRIEIGATGKHQGDERHLFGLEIPRGNTETRQGDPDAMTQIDT
jgi:hypothetical protein